LLHWEDFGPGNGRRIVNRWRDKLATFNDDMQGTGAVVMAALLNAVQLSGIPWHEHRVVIFGAGTAGVGIADQIRAQMMRDGLTEAAASRQFWLVDLPGLLLDSMADLRDYQQPYARPAAEVAGWTRTGPDGALSLLDTVRQAKPTILIGTSTAPQTFTREVAQAMAAASERPIIFPLSNPTPLSEATPQQLLTWTNGQALVATGSPFAPVTVGGVTHTIGQANNALLYPGLGLGVIVSRASRISDGLFLAAARALAESAGLHGPGANLLPPVSDMRATSATVAVAVAKQAAAEHLAQVPINGPVQMVQDAMWQPVYPTIKAV
jgi:malate dehydrogenase (oxaloacetate-decarboxylating)